MGRRQQHCPAPAAPGQLTGADLRLSLIQGTSSSGIILALRGKRVDVFLKGGVRHNRYTGYRSHLTFRFLPGSAVP